MSQVVSKSRTLEDSDITVRQHSWKRPIMIAFHGATACTYGYAIGWQSVSTAASTLYARSNPAMRVFGRWRFLTYNCLVMQFVAYSLCLTSHFVPRLRRQKDLFFTTIAFPVGMLVVTSFWAIWVVAGREYILPASLDPFYPPWLNHVTHTIIAPINLIELVAERHQYANDKSSLRWISSYILSYTSYLLYIRFHTGRFVYPFLNKMDAAPAGAFITGMAVFALVYYKSGRLIHDFVHGVKSIKSNTTKNNKAKKTN